MCSAINSLLNAILSSILTAFINEIKGPCFVFFFSGLFSTGPHVLVMQLMKPLDRKSVGVFKNKHTAQPALTHTTLRYFDDESVSSNPLKCRRLFVLEH